MATDLAFENKNKDYVDVMDLQPLTAIYAIKAERDIRYPEERFKF